MFSFLFVVASLLLLFRRFIFPHVHIVVGWLHDKESVRSRMLPRLSLDFLFFLVTFINRSSDFPSADTKM